jgi:hypothetical protein
MKTFRKSFFLLLLVVPVSARYKIVDAQIEFSSDATGTTTGLTLYQGGKTMPAKKIR